MSEDNIRVRQFMLQLGKELNSQLRTKNAERLSRIRQEDIQRLIAYYAEVKSRYFAMLLDVGAVPVIKSADRVADLRAYRTLMEEIENGIERLKAAIDAGEVAVEGVIQD